MRVSDSGLKSRKRARESTGSWKKKKKPRKVLSPGRLRTEVRGQTDAEGRCYGGMPPVIRLLWGDSAEPECMYNAI